MSDQQQVEWEAFVAASRARGECEFSGLRATWCVGGICDCFETPEGAAAIEKEAGLLRIYIAGPISADPSRTVEEKKAEFAKAQATLVELGYEAVSPLDVEPDCGLTSEACTAKTIYPERVGQGIHSWECYMKADLRAMLTCDAVLLLPAWDESPGARIEAQTASEVGMCVTSHADPLFERKFKFCRIDCAECKYLDSLDDRPDGEKKADALTRALTALTGGADFA